MADEKDNLQEDIADIEHTTAEPVEEPVEQPEPVQEEPVVEPEPKPEIPKRLAEEPKRIGAPMPGKMDKLRSFILECKRVLRVTKKPNKQEYTTIVKISAIGMAIMGVIGFFLHFLKELLF